MEKSNNVLIMGGGIAGMQSALLLAEKGHHVYVLDNAPAIGGFFPLLDRQFPTNSCGICFMSPKPPAYCPIYENCFHENIELLTNCDIKEVEGEAGNFEVTYTARPRYVDIEKCDLCGKCVEVCPVDVDKEFGEGLEKRKAIYLPFDQAIPRCYVIDDKTCTRCEECVKVCPPWAINLNEQPRDRKIKVGAVILGFGFQPFQSARKGEYGLGRYKNVMSSIQYERMLSCSSSMKGIPTRLSDGRQAGKVAFIQCVGSRDIACDQGYCSSICCMYATKQAMVSKERLSGLDCAIFYMDIRTVGKDYEQYYERAKNEHGVRYLRSGISTVRELKRSNRLLIEYGGDDGELLGEEFDIVVLSVGFTPPPGITEIARRIGVKLNEYNFCETSEFEPTRTSIPGIFVAGAFREPCDIPQTVVEACCATDDVSNLLDKFKDVIPVEAGVHKIADEVDEELRLGVFICDNKNQLSKSIDIKGIINDVHRAEEVVCIEKVDFTSLDAGLDKIKQILGDNKLNRVVITGYRCMEIGNAIKKNSEAFGVYHNLFDYVNIGEQCADVHLDSPLQASAKARQLIMAGINKVKSAIPRNIGKKNLQSRILVIGGGLAGLSSSISLAEQGMDVTLVEKETELGGLVRNYYYTLKGADIQGLINEMIMRAEAHPKIEVLKGAQLCHLEGTWGDYHSVISIGEESKELRHGAVILAVGTREVIPEGYLFGQDERVITQRSFEYLLVKEPEKAEKLINIAMIQCVNSRDNSHPYCSRICCSQSLKNALKLGEMNPGANIYVFYRDMRSYGFYEKYYQLARDKGIIFIRYDLETKPEVSATGATCATGEKLEIYFKDPVIGERISLKVDLLVLSPGIEPHDNHKLAEIAGVELNADGFFAEANPKAAPLDFVDRGKYFCGMCHSPNFIVDVICQGKAAAARASTLLWKGEGEYSDNQVFVKDRLCSGCGICVSACPYDARVINEESKKVKVLEDLCKGCGTCAISCPNAATQQYDFERTTILRVVDEVLS